jgi:cell wall-associated NlpC family hydrolase
MKALKKLLVLFFAFILIISAMLVNASAATAIASSAGKVTCDVLNIRENPDKASAVLTTLKQGDTVVILDKPSGDWYHINAYGTIGYVASQYIGEVEAAKNFAATGKLSGSDIRMRSAPSTSGDILGTYQSGTSVSVIGINNGWYKVKYDGKTGYIRSDLLELTGGGESRSVAAASGAAVSEGQKIADFAKQFNGYAYVYGAESPDVGFDCSGLMYYVYGHFGYTLERRASLQYANNGRAVTQAELQPGDLVFFGYDDQVCHVGMYIGDRNFIHACDSSTGVIISTLDSRWGTTSWFGAKRIVG